ncbi:DNA topoisomerase I [Nanoarchaeota archaeon]|nr:MAG: DNA topoisomerase I [Nanoarchaeota archaeon]
MRLIICEKNIAAKRIAQILSSSKAKTHYYSHKDDKVPYYKWDNNIVIGLSGHVFDVSFPEGFSSWNKVNEKELVKTELVYVVTKSAIVDTVRHFAKSADEVIIATDYDSEGESIGLEAVNIVKSVNPNVSIKRAVFSAITEKDIKESFANLKEVDVNLAHSADARREVDLIWGAALTRFISKSSKKTGNNFLSVGRVQTPTLKIIVDRERERMRFKPEKYWYIYAELKKGKKFIAEYSEKKLFDRDLAEKIASIKPKTARVIKVVKKKIERKPPIPFNTTEFLRAATSLGYTAQSAMLAAQNLYLKGYISYPRTDNTVYPSTINLRDVLKSLSKMRTLGPLARELLEKKDLKPTHGSKQTKDHPPIYPVAPATKAKLSEREWKIYELIVRRFFATLADPSVEEKTRVTFDINNYTFVSNGSSIISHGWRKYYTYSHAKENILPSLQEGETVDVIKVVSEEKETTPPQRYGYSSIIKIMDQLNLGTKATRPGILAKLVSRGYLSKGSQLVPSNVAVKVVEALEKHAKTITEPQMTAELEKEMEEIRSGKLDKQMVVDKSRKILLQTLDVLERNKDNIGKEIRSAFYWEPLGTCPVCKTGQMRIIKSKRTKKRFVGCSNYPKCKNGWPLPQRGRLEVLKEVCKHCGMRLVSISYPGSSKRTWKVCVNLSCPSRNKTKKK